jgi:hypothetical protein
VSRGRDTEIGGISAGIFRRERSDKKRDLTVSFALPYGKLLSSLGGLLYGLLNGNICGGLGGSIHGDVGNGGRSSGGGCGRGGRSVVLAYVLGDSGNGVQRDYQNAEQNCTVNGPALKLLALLSGLGTVQIRIGRGLAGNNVLQTLSLALLLADQEDQYNSRQQNQTTNDILQNAHTIKYLSILRNLQTTGYITTTNPAFQ